MDAAGRERLEQPGLQLGADTRAAVGHRQRRVMAVGHQPHRQRCAPGAVLDRVVQQVARQFT